MPDKRDYTTGQPNPPAAEAQAAPPVASGEDLSAACWDIVNGWNLARGYVTPESLEQLSRILHPEVDHA